MRPPSALPLSGPAQPAFTSSAVVSGTHLGNVDGQLVARPGGPGG